MNRRLPGRRLAFVLVLVVLGLLMAFPGAAKVVNENTDDLPPGCDSISEEIELEVHGGTEFAEGEPGVVFTFDERSFELPPCARVTVTFVNHDEVRHQFMPHGVYPDGSFLIEVDGPGQDTGTFITGSRAASVMVHCGVSQHQQKGMKAQLLVAGGLGDIPNIPGVSGLPPEDREDVGQTMGHEAPTSLAWLVVVAVALFAVAPLRLRRNG